MRDRRKDDFPLTSILLQQFVLFASFIQLFHVQGWMREEKLQHSFQAANWTTLFLLLDLHLLYVIIIVVKGGHLR